MIEALLYIVLSAGVVGAILMPALVVILADDGDPKR